MNQRPIQYRHYSEDVKNAVIASRVTNLFPKLNIPRTTAAYWISKKQKKKTKTDELQAERIRYLEKEILKEKALRDLVESTRKLLPHDLRTTMVKHKSTRQELVTTIKKAAELHPLKLCLKTIGITPRVYYRWTSADRACKIGQCSSKHPNQLTQDEINKMKSYTISKKYGHISIMSLCLLAQRDGALFCSLDTWYKYKKMLGWNRPNVNRKNYRKDIGVRANSCDKDI